MPQRSTLVGSSFNQTDHGKVRFSGYPRAAVLQRARLPHPGLGQSGVGRQRSGHRVHARISKSREACSLGTRDISCSLPGCTRGQAPATTSGSIVFFMRSAKTRDAETVPGRDQSRFSCQARRRPGATGIAGRGVSRLWHGDPGRHSNRRARALRLEPET